MAQKHIYLCTALYTHLYKWCIDINYRDSTWIHCYMSFLSLATFNTERNSIQRQVFRQFTHNVPSALFEISANFENRFQMFNSVSAQAVLAGKLAVLPWRLQKRWHFILNVCFLLNMRNILEAGLSGHLDSSYCRYFKQKCRWWYDGLVQIIPVPFQSDDFIHSSEI